MFFIILDDHSRVRLKGGDPNDPGRDYINANHINVYFFNSTYLC